MTFETFQASNILAGKGICRDPDRCPGLKIIQIMVIGTRYEFTIWLIESHSVNLTVLICRLLGPEDVKIVGEHPMAPQRFAISGRRNNDCKVVVRSYRCYVSFYIARGVATRYDHSLFRAVHS